MSNRDNSWSLSQTELDKFLQRLDPDRERAAQRYNRVREKLISYFRWERCEAPDVHADEVLDRVARRVAEGEAIQNIDAYTAGVARLVAREVRKATFRADERLRILSNSSATAKADTTALDCLEHCLERLPPESRAFILDYYSGDGQERIQKRKRMAEQMRMGLNALRNRALRLRASLQSCVHQCAARDTRGASATTELRGAGSGEGAE